MHIKLSANSVEASNYIASLGHNNSNYTYYYGFNSEHKLTEDSWSLKLFSTIEKLFFKASSLPEPQKQVAKHINDIANELSKSLDNENEKHIQDIEISLSVESGFNNWLRNQTGIFSLIMPTIGKVRANLLETGASINPRIKKMYFNLAFFEQTNIQKYPFVDELMKMLPLEDVIKLSIYHELSHAFQYSHKESKEIPWTEGASNFLSISKELIESSVCDYRNKLGERFSEQLVPGIEEKISILNFIDECLILEKEIYADIGSLLLIRNEKINNGTYSSDNMHKYINSLIRARCEDDHLSNYFNDFSSSISNFSHNTVCGLQYFKSIADTLPEKPLSLKEINLISDTCSKVGTSRILLISSHLKEDYIEQFKFLLNLEYNIEDEYITFSQNTNSEKSEFLWNKIKETAGNDWNKEFLNKIDESIAMITPHQLKTMWYAGTNPVGYEGDVVFNNRMVNDLKEQDIKHVKLKDLKANVEKMYYQNHAEYHKNKLKKNTINNSIQKIRGKFFESNSDSSKLKKNN